MKNLMACVAVVAFAAAVGCGSSGNKTDGGGGAGGAGGGTVTVNCGPFTACGGSIVGTWRYVSACGSFSSAACPMESTLTAPAPGSTATYTFGSGGVFTYTFSGTLNETVNYALGCLSGLTDAGVPQACADVQNLFRMSIGQNVGSSTTQLLSATCSAGQNETCDCTLVFSAQSQTTQGTYTVSGAQVTITDPDGGADASTPVDYCVSGNTLTLRLVSDGGSGLITLSR